MPGFSSLNARRLRAPLAIAVTLAAIVAVGRMRGADQKPATPPPMFQQYCFTCHGGKLATAGVSIEKLLAAPSVAEGFQTWQRVAVALEQNRMPPTGMPQPSADERAHAAAWVNEQLNAYVKVHAGDPGRVTVRRLTSGEYNYTIRDLTGLDLDVGIDASNDSVGGEGFTNFGDVQFMQDFEPGALPRSGEDSGRSRRGGRGPAAVL